MKNILFVASEPTNLSSSACDIEFKRLQDIWMDAPLRESFSIIPVEKLTGDGLIDKVRKLAPHYLHYCGHGNTEGEIQVNNLEGIAHTFRSDLFIKYLRRNHRLECVVLCSCNSEELVELIKDVSNYIIGFHGNVKNEEMHTFTEDFYSSLFEVGSPLHAYLMVVDKIRARKQLGNNLIFRTKLNYVMEIILQEELTAAQAIDFALQNGITLTDELIAVTDRDIEVMSGVYSDEFFEIMKTHPTPSEMIWFSSNKDILATQVATRLYREFSQQKMDYFAEELKLLYFGLESILLYYNDEASATEIFRTGVGAYPIQDYTNALNELRHITFGHTNSSDFNILLSKSLDLANSILTNLNA